MFAKELELVYQERLFEKKSHHSFKPKVDDWRDVSLAEKKNEVNLIVSLFYLFF